MYSISVGVQGQDPCKIGSSTILGPRLSQNSGSLPQDHGHQKELWCPRLTVLVGVVLTWAQGEKGVQDNVQKAT